LQKLYWESVQLSRTVWLVRLASLLVSLVVSLVSLAACRDEAPNPALQRLEPKVAPVETMARVLDVDAAVFEPQVDPVAPAGDLREEMEAFTTVDMCVMQRSRIDPMLGDSLDAIGYDTFFADACRVVDAAKAGDVKRCRAIPSSALRAHCRATVAELRALPNLCPWRQPDRPAAGREPSCVAIASRTAALCAVEHDPVDRASCVALLDRGSGGVAGCKRLFSRPERERCARRVARWQSALRAGGAASETGVDASAALDPWATLRVDHGGGADAGVVDVRPEVASGAVLLDEHGTTTFELGTLTDGTFGMLAAPAPSAAFGLEVSVGEGRAGAARARVRRLEIQLPGRRPFIVPSADAAALGVRVDALGRERGGPIALTIDGPLHAESAEVHLAIHTFVRDVVSAADALAAAARRDDDPGGNGIGP
jgi:hypothetical protein